MTTVQWFGVSALVVLFFGGIGLGRYFRMLDERKMDARENTPIRPLRENDDLLKFMAEYQAEVRRIAAGYHERLMLEGEAVADQWVSEQTRRNVERG